MPGPWRGLATHHALLALGVALRVALAVVNADANDDHFPVMAVIRSEGRLPQLEECWECYHPKLYHWLAAQAMDLVPGGSRALEVRAAQAVSCVAGILALLVTLRFVRAQPWRPSTRLLAFGLVALNPKLIAVSAQATNDALVILAGALTLHATDAFLRHGGSGAFLGMLASACLGALSKANGLVLVAGVLAILGLRALLPPPGEARARHAKLAALAGLVFAAAFVGSPYFTNTCRYGTPLAHPVPRDPPPHWVEPSVARRPGVLSIVDAYFTFRFVELLEEPQITAHPLLFPRHRTSLFTQLYARAHSLHYDGHPPTWISRSAWVPWIGRASFVLALVPTALAGLGVLVGAWALGSRIRRLRLGGLANSPELAAAVFACGFLTLIVLLTHHHRDYSSMKAIYVFPGMLAFLVAFGAGLERAVSRVPRLGPALRLAVGFLLLGYLADVGALLMELPLHPWAPFPTTGTLQPPPVLLTPPFPWCPG